MSRAAGLVADAVAAVIAARIVATLQGVPAELAAEVAAAAVRDLQGDGWHITALPAPIPLEMP